MKVLLVADESGRNEFLSQAPLPGCEVVTMDKLPDVPTADVDLLIDLLFTPDPLHLTSLKNTGIPLVMINSSSHDVTINPSFVRINGWPGFIGKEVLEAYCYDADLKHQTEVIVSQLGRKMEWTELANGFIGQRVIVSIINEAFLVLEEANATQEAIDTAMKLGTNYPYGPFEWANLIGLRDVMSVLDTIKKSQIDLHLSMLLKEKALAQ